MKWMCAPRALTPKFLCGVAGAALIVVATPVAAQSEARIERLEQQISALQRAVFPGGDERFFEPEITPEVRTNGQPRPHRK